MPGKLNKLGIGTNTNKYRKATCLLIDGKLTCPCCLRQNKAWHIHHFIQVMDKGRDIKQNLVVLCAICHRTIHEEVEEIGFVKWSVVRDLMWGRYGLVNLDKGLLRTMVEKFPIIDWSRLSSFRRVHFYMKMFCISRFYDYVIATQESAHPTGSTLGVVEII